MYTNANKYTGRFNSEFTFLKDRVKVGENITLCLYVQAMVLVTSMKAALSSMASYRSQPIIPVIHDSCMFLNGLSMLSNLVNTAVQVLLHDLGQAENDVATLTRAKDNTRLEHAYDRKCISLMLKLAAGFELQINPRRYISITV